MDIGSRGISSSQLVSLLVVSRLFTLFSYAPGEGGGVYGSAALLAIPMAAVGVLALLLPYRALCRRAGADALTAAFRVGSPYGTFFSLLICAFCIFIVAQTAGNFTWFMTSSIYQRASSWVLIFWLVLAAAYCASLGLEAFSRLGAFSFVTAAAFTLLIFCALIPKMEFVRVGNPFAEGTSSVFQAALRLLLSHTEMLIFILLLPRVKQGGKQGGKHADVMWLSYAVVFYELLGFASLTALGDYAKIRLFPIHTVASVAELPVVGRLELVYIIFWVLTGFLRATIWTYCGAVCLRRVFRKLPLGAAAAICGLLGGIGAFISTSNVPLLRKSGGMAATGIPLMLLAVVFPLVTVLIPKSKAPNAAPMVDGEAGK